MILLFSNRKINLANQGADVFLPCEKPIGGEDVLLASATAAGGGWVVDLVPSPPQGDWNSCLPSRALLADLVRRMNAREHDTSPGGLRYDQENKTYNWIFFVPGYNSTASSGLQRAKQLEEEYQANVMLFSWPADPPATIINPIRAYKQAQAAARVTAIQLDQTIEGLKELFTDPLRQENQPIGFRFCLLMHSLGNYVFESYIRNPVYGGETNIFDTIILHQPDVNHPELHEWVNKIAFKDSIYLTFNTFDTVLKFSMTINSVRAGIAGGDDPSKMVKFIDFTHGKNIAAKHFMFTELDNRIVKEACRRMIRGVPGGGAFNLSLDGERGFTHYPDTNTYVLSDPKWKTNNG